MHLIPKPRMLLIIHKIKQLKILIIALIEMLNQDLPTTDN